MPSLVRRRAPRLMQFALSSCTLAAVFVACGSRTGLLLDDSEPPIDASVAVMADSTPDSRADVRDAHRDARDAPEGAFDAPVEAEASIDAAPIFEGGALDAQPECTTPTYCDPKDPGKIFKCDVAVFQCNSLEQCQPAGEEGATCVNPCVDTLGQNTSNGCEFYAAEMDTTPEVAGVCYAVFVVNQWKTGEPARIEVSLDGNVLPIAQFARIPVGNGTTTTYVPYDPNVGLAKDQIAILFLSRDPNAKNDPTPDDPRVLADCPSGVTPAVSGDAALHGTGTASAFHIRTNVPVVSYEMLPFGAGRARVTSATLLLPTNVWGTNYLATSAYDAPTLLGGTSDATLMILGERDDTHVTIRPTQPIQPGGGLAGTPQGVPVTYTVNQGQYLQITQTEDLTGSAIQSDSPIAIVGGTQLMDVPVDHARADTGHQMLPPVQSLGNQYLAVRYRARAHRPEEAVPWRIIGAVDGTQLTFDPPQARAPTTINSQQLIELTAPGPFVISSQDNLHPFYLAQYMTGGQFQVGGMGNDNLLDGEGDPEFVNVISPAQYLSRYTFFTDPTYPETNLVVTRVLDPTLGVFPDVTLDCAGLLTGWQPVGSSGQFQFTRVDLSTGNFQGQNGCNNGVHVIEAALPSMTDGGAGPVPFFGVTVWGWGNLITDPTPGDDTNPAYTRWVSYAYPAGANFTQLNSVVVPAN